MKLNIARKAIFGGLFCLFAALSFSSNSYATVAPIYFTDDSANSSNTIVHIDGTPASGNTYVYFVSSDSNAVPTPAIGVDNLSTWTPVVSGQSITAANGQHIGIAEIDGSSVAVDFRDGTAVTLAEFAAPSVSADDTLNTITGIDTTMEFSVDGSSYVLYNGSNLPNLAGSHTVLVRIAAVANVSNASPATTLTFNYANAAPAAPSVTANDTANTITGIDTTMEFSVDSGSYVKYNGSNAPDLTGNHFVRVRVAENIATDTPAGSVTSLFFTTNITTPAAPSVSANDTLNTIIGIDTTMEFSVDDAVFVLYDGTNLPSLAGNHTVLVRIAAVAGVSNASSVTTLNFTYANTSPAAPAVTADDVNNLISGLDTTMEFNVDGAGFIKYNGLNAPSLSGIHFVSVRVAENLATDTPAGSATNLFFTTNLTTPSAPTVTADDVNNLIVGLTTAMEYNIDGSGFEQYDGINAPNLAGNHTVRVRVAAVAGVNNAGSITTLTFAYANSAPAAPAVTADDVNNLISGLDTTMEYSIDGGDYSNYDGVNAPDLSGTHFVLVRIMENPVTDTPTGIAKGLYFTDNSATTVSGVSDGAYYNTNIVITYSGSNITSVTLDGAPFISGSTVSAEGSHVLIVTDSISGAQTYNFVIDKTAPVIGNVANNGYYNVNVSPIYSDANIASANLDGSAFVSGSTVSTIGVHTLLVTDMAGNATTVTFTIDKTNPLVLGVADGAYYGNNRTITFSDTNLSGATLNGNPFVSNTVVSAEGNYVLVVTDLAGNTTTVNFTIDKTNPLVTGVVDNTYYNSDVTISFSDANISGATLNGNPFVSGATVSAEGNYTLVVTDLAGNSTSVGFVIDKTAPVVTGVVNGNTYNANVTISFSDTNILGATLNGAAFVSGTQVSANGSYVLIVTDLAGNKTTINFTIAKTIAAVLNNYTATDEAESNPTTQNGQTSSTSTDEEDDNSDSENVNSDDNGSTFAWLMTTLGIVIVAFGAGAGAWMFIKKRK